MTSTSSPQEQPLRLRRGAEMHFLGKHAQNGPRPRIAPLPVADHLALVDDCHVEMPLHIQLFRRSRHMGIPVPHILLLAGGEAAIHAVIQQRLLRLQRQQTKGRKVYASVRPNEPLKARIGLARVRPADVHHEMPLQGAGLRVFVLGVQGHQQFQTAADGPRHIEHRIEVVQRMVQKLLHREFLHAQQLSGLRLRLGQGKILQRPICRSQQGRGIVFLQSCLRFLRRSAQPEPRRSETLQLGRRGRAALALMLLQREEMPQIAGGLPVPQTLLRVMAHHSQNAVMIVPRQHLRVGIRVRRDRPALPQERERRMEHRPHLSLLLYLRSRVRLPDMPEPRLKIRQVFRAQHIIL